jgi:hypothetical protein
MFESSRTTLAIAVKEMEEKNVSFFFSEIFPLLPRACFRTFMPQHIEDIEDIWFIAVNLDQVDPT